ncbi:MAG: DUF3566 domain-containing protein [Kutzneria sp.]|nr:DUF3566 domain-containing protein [Kutzneria sp.]
MATDPGDKPAGEPERLPSSSDAGTTHEQETTRFDVAQLRTEGSADTVVPPPWQRVPLDVAGAEHESTAGQLTVTNPPEPEPEQEPATAETATEVEVATAAEATTTFQPVASAAEATTSFRPVTSIADVAAAPDDPFGLSGAGSSAARTAVNLGGAVPRSPGVPTALRRPGRGPRRASLQVKRIDPWSVLKLALVLGFAMFLIWMVAIGVLYGVLQGMGVWDKLNGTYNDLVQSGGNLISAGGVFGAAAVVGLVNVVLFAALATVGTFVYNVSADLVGGVEVTLSERD